MGEFVQELRHDAAVALIMAIGRCMAATPGAVISRWQTGSLRARVAYLLVQNGQLVLLCGSRLQQRLEVFRERGMPPRQRPNRRFPAAPQGSETPVGEDMLNPRAHR
jgi:hypothetical protein